MKIRPASWDCRAWHCRHAALGFAHPRNHLLRFPCPINIDGIFANQVSRDTET